MDLTFLSGPVPLTKTITYNNREQSYHTTSYPLVQKVTSHVESVDNITDFFFALGDHGAQGRALLKGNLSRPLANESRAGAWLDAPSSWVVFDFDKVDCAPTVEGALVAIARYLPPECQDVDAIIQLSGSCFRPDATQLSCHIFMLLDKPATTAELTDWITHLNFTNEHLKKQIKLSDSCIALHFPLDRSVCVPSRLIYIAPPRCFGFVPPVSGALALNDGARRAITITPFKRVPAADLHAQITELREAVGMPARPYTTRTHKGIEMLIDAEPAVVHDIKPSGEGYIRFNLNGGNSLAYYINLKDPNLIGNHKGEPFLVTESVAPDLYKALIKTSKNVPLKAMQSCAIEPLAFYATNRGSQLYVGSYDRANDQLRIDMTSKDAANSWLASYGVPRAPNFPHYDLVFNMTSALRFEDGYPMINLYRQTDLVKQFADIPRTRQVNGQLEEHLKGIAPVTYRVLDSVLGNDSTAMTYFLNWIAAVFQRREKSNTAWVVSGIEGTGKGFLTNYICRHLFGNDAVTQQLYEHVNDKFNEFLEGKLIVSLNEAAMSKSIDASNVMSKLRDWITEPQIVIRGMHKAGREATNSANFIVCSNSKSRPVVIEAHDRRFNFGEFQEKRLLVSPNELATVTEGLEMAAFAQFLGEIQVDNNRLNTPYVGETKTRVYEATHNLLDRAARAIDEGDVEYFLEVRPSTIQLQTDFAGKMLPSREYDDLIRGMMNGSLTALRHEDLYVLFRMIAISDKIFPETKASQRQIFQRYNLLSNQPVFDKRHDKTVRGTKAPAWKVSEAAQTMYADLLGVKMPADNVRAIK
jgi:hypothetical protein